MSGCTSWRDRSDRYTADKWPKEAVTLAIDIGASLIIVETNRGGDLAIQAVTDERDRRGRSDIGVQGVFAHDSKETRADPVARLYALKRVVHIGDLSQLEDQQLTWDPRKEKSPDRIDAEVWAVWELAGETAGDYSTDYDQARTRSSIETEKRARRRRPATPGSERTRTMHARPVRCGWGEHDLSSGCRCPVQDKVLTYGGFIESIRNVAHDVRGRRGRRRMVLSPSQGAPPAWYLNPGPVLPDAASRRRSVR